MTTATRVPRGGIPADLRNRPLKVFLAGKWTALDAPGGGETQLLAMARALPEVGVDARLWRPWEERLGDADVLHLFGSEREHLHLVAAARRLGLAVVLSTIAWFDLQSLWREPWSLTRRLAACGRYLARGAVPAIPSWRRALYRSVDALLPNSKAEAQQLTRLFGVPESRARIIPNGAELRFASADPDPFARLVGGTGFVLYAGRVEPRKNQLEYLRAMRDEPTPIVILGDAPPEHREYLAACKREAGPLVRFLPRLDHADPLLASAYTACGCLALMSWFETPGLVAIEAAMSGTPLVLPAIGCAREYFQEKARYVRPGDLVGARDATRAALRSERDPELARLARERYSWRAAAEATKAAYADVVRGSGEDAVTRRSSAARSSRPFSRVFLGRTLGQAT